MANTYFQGSTFALLLWDLMIQLEANHWKAILALLPEMYHSFDIRLIFESQTKTPIHRYFFVILTILLSTTLSSMSSFNDGGGICLLGKGLRPGLLYTQLLFHQCLLFGEGRMPQHTTHGPTQPSLLDMIKPSIWVIFKERNFDLVYRGRDWTQSCQMTIFSSTIWAIHTYIGLLFLALLSDLIWLWGWKMGRSTFYN